MIMAFKNVWDGLTDEQKAKAKDCKSPEDMLSLAKEVGYALSEEELEAISGGASWDCISDCNDHTPCSQNR